MQPLLAASSCQNNLQLIDIMAALGHHELNHALQSAGTSQMAVRWSMADKHGHCGADPLQHRLLLVKRATTPPDSVAQQPSHVHGGSLPLSSNLEMHDICSA